MFRLILIGAVGILFGAIAGVFAYMSIVPLPTDAMARQVAFESDDPDWVYQNAAEVFPTRTVSRREDGTPLPSQLGLLDDFAFTHQGETKTMGDLFTDMETSGLMVLVDGEIVYESYGRGAGPGTRFATYSLVKSITSTLVGFAVGDGLIDSVEDPLETYLPEVIGTAYEGVTVRQALEMSSGVEFDPGLMEGDGMPDTLDLMVEGPILGRTPTFELAIAHPRVAEPGTVFNYNTAESQVLLELVRRVTGGSAAAYLEQKVWRPLGMDHDAGWILDRAGPDGAEIGGAFFNASLRDWARFGLFISQNGQWEGEQLLPVDWVASATRSDLDYLQPGTDVHVSRKRGYAWHWWTFESGAFTASGAFGQSLYIDQANGLVVARASGWPDGYVAESDALTTSFYEALGRWVTSNRDAMDSAAANTGVEPEQDPL